MTDPLPLPQKTNSGLPLRIGVVVLGVLVCGLLFFADKSSLENKIEAGLSAPTSAGSSTSLSLDRLPPLGEDPRLVAWQSELTSLEAQDRLPVLDSLVDNLRQRGRADAAMLYAAEALSIDSTLARKTLTGMLACEASRLPFVKEDEALFRSFNQQGIALLEEVNQVAPDQEAVLLQLGLAYVASGLPENSMKGILTVRKVLEINPANVEAAFQLGIFSVQSGQLEKAEERFRAVLEMAPDRHDARYELASLWASLGRKAEAIPLLETVVQDAKDNELRLQAGVLLDDIR